MSLNCYRNRRASQYLWFSLVIITLVGCGILLYFSYIYTGNFNASCEKCQEISVTLSEKLTQGTCQKVCFSKECIFAANFILENMDQNVNPCEDFYHFSCGNWMRQYSRSDNYSVIDGMDISLKLKLKDLLDNLKGPPRSGAAKLKMMYDSCLSEHASESKAIHTVLEFLKKIGIEGWPNLKSDFEFISSSLELVLGKLAAYNEFAFVTLKPTEHETGEPGSGGSLHNLTVTSGFFLIRDEPESEMYETILLEVLHHFGIDNENAYRMWENFKSVDAAVLRLYVDSSDTAREDEDAEEVSKYLNCASEISDTSVPICGMLKHFVEENEIGNSFSIENAYISNAHYVENIFPIMKDFSHRSLANYLALRFIIEHLDILNIFFRVIMMRHPDIYSLNMESKTILNKWKHCVWWISSAMPYALGQQYVSKALAQDELEEMHDIVQTYIQEATNYIRKLKWIEAVRREQLESAVENMKDVLDYSVNSLVNGSTLNSLLEGFEPTNESFLQNALEYRKHVFTFYFRHFEALQTEEFPSDIFTVNAYHSSGLLGLRFGMFMPPVYQYGLPKLMNLVTMGTTIAHEIGHELMGFFEDEYNLDNETSNVYMEKKKCLKEQYFGYEVKKIGKMVNGNQTIYENLPDLIGIEITQRIISNFIEKENENLELALPALTFSKRQLLYISLAQMWCSTRSKENDQLHYDGDTHAPSDVRIAGMLRNLKEFSEAFNCPPRSNMNPTQRCSIRD